MKNIYIVLLILALTACQGNKTQTASDAETMKTTIATDSVAAPQEVQSGTEQDEVSQDESDVSNEISARGLNDIRFDGWTEDDWLDNDYIRALRKYIDDYCKGEIENAELDPYKAVMQSQFAVLATGPNPYGGVQLYVVFLESPETVFYAWVYSKVNDNEVLGIQVWQMWPTDKESGHTKEEILSLIEKNPKHKLW